MTIAVLLATQPSNSLNDPEFVVTTVLSVIAVILTLAGIFVTIWIYRRQKSKKEISYQIISDTPVVSVDQGIAKQVEIQFDGNPVTEVTQVVIKVRNSGNTAIKKEDFDARLGFKFEGRKVISHDPIDPDPKDWLSDKEKKDLLEHPADDITELKPILLNEKKSITLSVLLDGSRGEISQQGRIIGGEIVKFDPENQPVKVSIFSVLPYILLLVLFAVWIPIILYSPANIAYPINLAAIFIVAISIASGLLYYNISIYRNIAKKGVTITWRN